MSKCTHLVTAVKSKPHVMVPLEGGVLCHPKEHETGPLGANRPGEAIGVSGFRSIFARLPGSLGSWLTEGQPLNS